MKKLGFFCLLAASALGFSQTVAAETVQVGEINSFNNTTAIADLVNSRYEIIYPAERLQGLNGACMIDEIAFPYVQYEQGGAVAGPYTCNMKVYFENTTDAEVGREFHDTSSMTLVYGGDKTYYGGSEANPNWDVYAFDTPFEYTGRNIRMVVVKEASIYSVVEWGLQWNWKVPYLMQKSWGGDYDWEALKRNNNVFPVTRFETSPIVASPTLTASLYNWQLGNATIGETYTQTVTINGQRLTGDVTVASANHLVAVDKTTITKAEAEAGATLTMSLTPLGEVSTADQVVISSPGCDDIVLNVTWTPKWKKPDATITVNPTALNAGDAPLLNPVVKTIEINTTGTLYNGITVSEPTTPYVTVSPLKISNGELEANGGKATLTVTITPDNTDVSADKIVLTSRGMDDIEVPIRWNPVLGYEPNVHTIGECNDYSQKLPLFSTWEASESETVYRAKDLGMKKGEKIRRIAYPMTFNSTAIDEEITVSLQNTTDKEVGDAFTEGMTQVVKTVKRIPAGGNIEQATPFYYLTLDLPEAFEYNGANLRIRIKGVSEGVSERWYFSNDTKKKGEMPILIRAAGTEAELPSCSVADKNMQRTRASFPVIQITTVDESSDTETVITLSENSWVNQTVGLNHEYTKEISVSAQNLKGDITVGTPTSSAVTVNPTVIAKSDVDNGTAKFTVTLNATELNTKEASFTLTSEGADAITFPVFWTPSDIEVLPTAQAGEILDWSAYAPFDLTSTQSHSEFIYRAADLNLDGSNKYLKEIAYPYYHYAMHGDADPLTANVAVYVQNTDADDVPNDDEGFTDFSQLTKVFEGEVTFDGGSMQDPEWISFPFSETFLYTGGNLRVVCTHDSGESQASFNRFFFGQDTEKAKNQYCLYTYDNEIRYNTERHYPVARLSLDDAPTVKLDVASWEAGVVEAGKTYTKTVTVNASGLVGDIIISDPQTSEVTVEPQFISKDAAASATFTLTLTPSESSANGDYVEIFTEGGETITFPINWSLQGSVGSLVFDQPRQVSVYDVLGRQVVNTEVEGNLQSALEKVLNQGIYVVKAGNEVYKVKINK